jgi:hypothetical protein
MKFVILLLTVLFFQALPYKPNEEFEIKLDYKFKQRPSVEASKINLSESRAEHDRRTSTGVLPYLILNLKMLKLNNETRVRVSNNTSNKVYNKKISEGVTIPIDMGFTADVKDRVAPYEYTVTFLSPEKNETSRIVIFVDEDGSFLVNGEKRGRF